MRWPLSSGLLETDQSEGQLLYRAVLQFHFHQQGPAYGTWEAVEFLESF